MLIAILAAYPSPARPVPPLLGDYKLSSTHSPIRDGECELPVPPASPKPPLYPDLLSFPASENVFKVSASESFEEAVDIAPFLHDGGMLRNINESGELELAVFMRSGTRLLIEPPVPKTHELEELARLTPMQSRGPGSHDFQEHWNRAMKDGKDAYREARYYLSEMEAISIPIRSMRICAGILLEYHEQQDLTD